MQKKDIKGFDPEQFVNGVNAGTTIFNTVFPLIKEGFVKLAEMIREINKDKLSTPAGKKEAIKILIEQVQVLQAQNKLQKKWNSALIAELAKHDVVIDEDGEPGNPEFENPA